MAVYDSVAQLTGRTPLLRLTKLSALYGCRTPILAKLECFNPTGSVKDRAVFSMLLAAMEEGQLPPGGAVIEATGGNTAISLAMACATLSLRAYIVMPEGVEPPLTQLLKAYGAKVVLTPGGEGLPGALEKARQLQKELNAFMPSPFENDQGCEIHRRCTGPEILQDVPQVDYFVCGIGTGATFTGCGEFIKSRCMDCRLVAVEPNDSPVLSGGLPSSHAIRGLGAGFVPPILNVPLIDEIIRVRTPDALELCRELGRTEGLLCGISSGAALAAAVSVACREEAEGKTVVTILPDGGERYLLADLYPL